MTEDESSDLRELWACEDCNHEEVAPIDELAGERITITVGRRNEEKETVKCPSCGSDNWHSASVRELMGTVDEAVSQYDE